MSLLETLSINSWESSISQDLQQQAVQALEGGKVLYFPSLPFTLDRHEQSLLRADIMEGNAKNISYDNRRDAIAGASCQGDEAALLKAMISRYSVTARKFLETLIPHYSKTLSQGKTSYRPVEIHGRKGTGSYRQNDTLLHVDSFPSNPTAGKRILRLFTNINPKGQPRVWRLGESFESVLERMVPRVRAPLPGMSRLMKLLKITKSYRTPYDHYMGAIHDTMKGDSQYQRTVEQEEIHFPSGSSWIVFTDKTSHAAMSGQYVLEQTFHLPVEGLMYESLSPLRQLESFLNKKLV